MSVFKVDAGVDTGPIVVQKRGVPIEPTDNTVSLYYDRLYALGVDAMAEAVAAVADGSAKPTPQSEVGASFQGLVDDTVARIDWLQPGRVIDQLIRGCDPAPGAWAELAGQPFRLFGCRFISQAEAGDGDGAGAAEPGTVLGLDPESARLQIAVAGGVLAVEKLKRTDGPKQKASEAELAEGSRFA